MEYDTQRSGQQNPEERGVTPSADDGVKSMHRMDIYVNNHCANCAYAWEIADLIRSEYPHVRVTMVDLADPQEPVPESVFATPTYLLDGQVWSLGNPSPHQVRETLTFLT